MSDKFLSSPSPLLDTLSKEMLYRLNHYPMLAVKYEKVEYFCSRFRLLFNGAYRSIRFETSLLCSCITHYCKCILIFIQDNVVKMKKNEVDYLNRWLSILDNIGGVDSIKNKFTFLIPVLNIVIYEDLPLWVKKEFILHLNRIFEKPTQLIFNKKEKDFFFVTMSTWLQLLTNCGDYEFQTILVEAIISSCELCHFEELLRDNLGDKNVWTRKFLEVYSKQNYVNDLKTLLMGINDHFGSVRSVPCLKVTLEEIVIPPLKDMTPDTTWMHVNYGFNTLSFSCHRDSLRSLPGSTNNSNFYEFVTVNFEDIGKICLLINNDTKTVNSVGGIFLLNLTGKCLCRFDSSKEIVSSIKKIVLTVPDGSHLQFLKEAFTKLFGKRFKEDSDIPIKKKNFLDKRGFPLSSSTQNLSYQAKNRRRMKKHSDSMMSQTSSFKQNLKLENSLTLKNKKYVLEENKNSFLNFTESPFKKNVVVDNKETTNSQPKFINNQENEIVGNLSAKLDYTNKNNMEDSENDRLFMSPDTTTNEFMNEKESGLISLPHSTKKSIRSKKGKGRRVTTKRNLSLLKNLDIDILTTPKSKEIPEGSRISPTLATTEEINIPSNSKFGEDNSLSILEENKSSILDFINDELNSIPDLRSPLGLKNKSSKIKTSKAKKVNHISNFGIADSSSTIVNSFVSKTISNAKNNGPHFGVTHTESSSKENQLNDIRKSINLPEFTYNYKKSSSSVNSINSLKRLTKKVKHTSNCSISSMEANSSISKTISNAKDDWPRFDVTRVELSSKESHLNDLRKSINLPEFTYKYKKSSSSVISNNPLKHLVENLKKDSENRRMQSKEGIETVNRWLNSSETVESDFFCARSNQTREAPDGVYLKNKGNEIIDFVEGNYNLCNKNKGQRRNALNMEMSDSYALQNTEEIVNTTKSNGNKNLISNALLEFDNRKKPIKIDYSFSLENTQVIDEIVNEEKSEYYSIVQDDVPLEGNKKSNPINNYFETSALNLEKENALKKLINMNTEEIGNVGVVYRKETCNDDMLTLDNDIVNVAESEYYSIDPDISPISDDSATPDLDVEKKKEKTNTFRSHPLQKLMLMNSEEIINLSVEENRYIKVNEALVTSDQQILEVEESEYYSIINESFENNSKTLNVDLNNFNNGELKKLNKFDHSKNKQEAIIERCKNNDVMLDQQESQYYLFNPNFTSTENNKVSSEMRNSESIDIPNMSNKNGRISKASTLELSKLHNSFTLKNTTEQSIENEESLNLELMFRRVNFAEESEIVSNASYCKESNQSNESSETPDLDFILAHSTNFISELKNSNENTDEDIRINNVRLSTETVKIDNWGFPSSIPEDSITQIMSLRTSEKQTRNYDDNSIISISSMEELESDASTEVLDELQTHSFENQPIDDVPKTNADVKKMQITEIIQDECRTQNEVDEHLMIISISSTKESFSNNESVCNVTRTHSERVKNKGIKDKQIKNGSVAQEKIENDVQFYDVVKTNNMQNLQIIEINDISEEIIQDESEKQKDTDDHVIIISTSLTEGSILDSQLDNKATGINHSENIKNNQYDVVKLIADAQKLSVPIISVITEEMIEDVSEKQEDGDDHVIISISSTELNDKAMGINYSKDVKNKVTNNKQYVISKSNADVQNFQIPKIIDIQDVSEKQENTDDSLIIISSSSSERNISGTELDDNATEISYPKNAKNKFTDNEASEHNSFADEIEIAVKYDDKLKTDSDIEKIEIQKIIDTTTNEQCYSSSQAANKTKNDEDYFIEIKSGHSSVDDTSPRKEIKEFNTDHFDFELPQLTAVPTLSNEIDYQEKANTISNDVLDLNTTNVDVSLTDLLNKHQERLDKNSKSIEELENSFKSTKSKNMQHISISCDEGNAFVVRNKINILSNIRIAPALYSKINKSHNDVQLLNEKYVAVSNDLQQSKNEITTLHAELANKTQKLEELLRINKENLEIMHNSGSNKACRKKSVTCKKRKRTKDITGKSKDNSEIFNENFEKITSFQEFIESPRNRLKGLPPKKVLQNKFNASQSDSIQSTSKTNISMESDCEMLIARNELNSQELELSPKKALFDLVATSEKKNMTPSIHELQNSQDFSNHNEFLSVLSNKSLLDQSVAEENNRKFSQDGEISNFVKSNVWNEKINEGEEFSLTSASKKRLADKTAASNAEKRIKLAEGVQLSCKMHKPEEDSFERSPLKKFNEHKKSTPGGELSQKMRKTKVCDLDMIEIENEELDHSREFVSIGKVFEKSFASSKEKTKKLTDVQPTPKTHKSKIINEDLNFIQVFESIPKTPQLHKSEPVKVRKFKDHEFQSTSRKQKSKENSSKRLEVINEELGLITKQSTVSGNELNKNIQFDFDNIKMDTGGLYNLISKPHKLYNKSDKTGEAFQVDSGIVNKRNEVHSDEYAVDQIYGFDAMLSAYTCYLETLKLPKERRKKPQKRKIINIKVGSHKNSKSKPKKKNYGKLFKIF